SFVSVDCKNANTASAWRESVTTDGGKTWSRQGTQIPGADSEDFESSLVAAASTKSLWVSLSTQHSLLHSGDGGETWVIQPVSGLVSGLSLADGWVWALSSCQGTDSTCAPVLQRESVGGGTWQTLAMPQLQSGAPPRLLVISPQVILVLAELVGKSPGELLVTLDAGQTWTVQSTPVGPSNVCTQDIGVA